MREISTYATRHAAQYRSQIVQRASQALPATPTLAVGSFVMLLRPRTRKLQVPNTGPYLITAVREHTYVLRNLATNGELVEAKSNVRPFLLGPGAGAHPIALGIV